MPEMTKSPCMSFEVFEAETVNDGADVTFFGAIVLHRLRNSAVIRKARSSTVERANTRCICSSVCYLLMADIDVNDSEFTDNKNFIRVFWCPVDLILQKYSLK